MTTAPLDWSARFSAQIGANIKTARLRAGLGVQEVANLCTDEIGYPLARPTLANIEAGKRKNITVAEVVALAHALGTSPMALIYPLPGVDRVEYLPGAPVAPWEAWDRFTSPLTENMNSTNLPGDDSDPQVKAVAYLTRFNVLAKNWDMLLQMRQQEGLPSSVRESLDAEMSRTVAGAAVFYTELLPLEVNLDGQDATFMEAVRQVAAASGRDDAAPSA